jgi:hypothetical protein
VVIRYYSDTTIYLLKPEKNEGSFRTIFNLAQALEMARNQQGRDLAVIVLEHYDNPADESFVKQKLTQQLSTLGYRRTVFLRGSNQMQINGLPVLEELPTVATAGLSERTR